MRKKQSLLRRMLTARGRSLDITRAGWLFTAIPAASFSAVAAVMALAASGAWLLARSRRDLFASE